MNEIFPELSGSSAQGVQQDSADEGIAENQGNSKQKDNVQANSDQQQCGQGQECGVVLDVKKLNEVAIHDIHDEYSNLVKPSNHDDSDDSDDSDCAFIPPDKEDSTESDKGSGDDENYDNS